MVWSPLLALQIGCLTTNQREGAMGMLGADVSVRRVSQTFNVRLNNHSTIQYVSSVKIEH